MKQVTKPLLAILLALAVTLVQLSAFAQENSGGSTTTETVNIKTESTETWYASPWVWIIGAAVFILLLVALAGGRSRTRTTSATTTTRDEGDRVVTKKTVRDTDDDI